GTVEVLRAKAGIWERGYTNQILSAGDRLRTMERSRAVVHIPNISPVRVGELSLMEMPPAQKRGFSLLRGLVYFFHRDDPGALEVQTPTMAALIRGTEFHLKVEQDVSTTLSMF